MNDTPKTPPLIEPGNPPNKKVEYEFPPFHRRVLGCLVDIFLFVLLFFSLFLLTRGITAQTKQYKSKMQQMTQMRLDSCLYMPVNKKSRIVSDYDKYFQSAKKELPKKNKDISDVITLIDDGKWYSPGQKIEISRLAVKGFLTYINAVASPEDYQKVVEDYNNFFTGFDIDGVKPFVVKKDEASTWGVDVDIYVIKEGINIKEKDIFDKGYRPYFDEHAQAFLVTAVPGYYDCVKYFSNILLFAEIPVPFVVTAFLVYLFPMLIFRHGRMTFGKALYHIGCLDRRCLSPSLGRAFAKFSIFFFGELLLSFFTFGIPYLLSFSLMAFSRQNQGFPDYMLGIVEVDTTRNRIYMSMEEAALKYVDTHREPIPFKRRGDL